MPSWTVFAAPYPFSIITLLLLAVYASVVSKWRTRTRGHPLPPGPSWYALLRGQLFGDKRDLWDVNADLRNTYGDVVYIPTLSENIVLLGSSQAIFDLLEKHSAITSDRPQTPLTELLGQTFNLSIMGYGDWWRRHRRAFWQHFTPTSTVKHATTQCAFARLFARKLLAEPDTLIEHIRYTFAAAIVKIIYGFDVEQSGDPYIARMEEVLKSLVAFTPGQFMVESLPILRFVPEWVPGAGFQKKFAAARRTANGIKEDLYSRTKEGMVTGETSSCVMAETLKRLADDEDGEEIAKNVSLISFEAGADTTFSTLQSFFLAMSLYPEVQKKAQAELDLVVGPDRFPDHDDKPMLPYVNAIVKESLRWQTVLPISIFHRTTEDIVYNGYFLPAGTIIVPDTWGCLHDPVAYPEPTQFIPERFLRDGKLDTTIRDPAKFAFGYGRRICPGKHFAENSLFINIATVLHAFEITPPSDAEGRPIRIEPSTTNTIVSYPKNCRCTVTPRSEKMKALILGD